MLKRQIESFLFKSLFKTKTLFTPPSFLYIIYTSLIFLSSWVVVWRGGNYSKSKPWNGDWNNSLVLEIRREPDLDWWKSKYWEGCFCFFLTNNLDWNLTEVIETYITWKEEQNNPRLLLPLLYPRIIRGTSPSNFYASLDPQMTRHIAAYNNFLRTFSQRVILPFLFNFIKKRALCNFC